jgi:predicted transcriptional regulator
MHTVSPAPHDRADVPRLEAEVRRQRQRTPDAAMIAEARAPASAGHVVSSEEVDAWIDSLDMDHELPAPCSVQ